MLGSQYQLQWQLRLTHHGDTAPALLLFLTTIRYLPLFRDLRLLPAMIQGTGKAMEYNTAITHATAACHVCIVYCSQLMKTDFAESCLTNFGYWDDKYGASSFDHHFI